MIITQFNDVFFKWGVLFTKSLIFTNPNEKVYLDTVNLNQEQINELKSISGNVTIDNEIINFSSDVNVPAYMANRRVEVFLKILSKEVEDRYFLFDADILFRKPLNDLNSKLGESSDAAIIFRDGMWAGNIYEHLKVACGIVGVTKKGIPLIKIWYDIMKTEKSLYGIQAWKWYWDQITLLEATRRVKDVKFSKIEDNLYINRDFNEDSHIWSANKPPKDLMYILFCKEFEKMKGK